MSLLRIPYITNPYNFIAQAPPPEKVFKKGRIVTNFVKRKRAIEQAIEMVVFEVLLWLGCIHTAATSFSYSRASDHIW
jgi:hypothetical protein